MREKGKIMPQTYFYVLILLSMVLNFLFPIKKIIFSPYIYLGIIIFILGMWIDIWAWVIFKKKKTTLNPYKNPMKLITTSLYKISRNPMYLGMFIALLGLSIFLGSLSTFIFPILFFILMERIFIIPEEKKLEKTFGKEYIEYKNEVRRWM